MTVGKLLFVGGIAGFVLAIILLILSIFFLKSKKNSLENRLDEKY